MRRSWAERALWPAGVVLGLAAEYAAYGFDEPAKAAADLATGWIVLGCGLVLWRRGERTGPLLAATGLTWFLGNFAAAALYVHRGPLIHALTANRLAISVGYMAAVIEPV